jgi:RNA polymerase sigma-70 factor (ECF subfamily)
VHAVAEDVSLAFLALLEQLAPEERAAFLLKEVFDHDYPQVAALLGHSQANCRQMVHRARMRLQEGRPRFSADAGQHRRLLARFLDASQRGDSEAIQALLHANARHVSDGGGVVTAGIRPLLGAERIGRLYWAIARRGGALPARLGTVNGEPAILRFDGTRLQSVTTIVVEDDRIRAVYSVLNPDKLRGAVTARDGDASLA